ncbi:hypothetical protein D9M70_469190 [compost metagenome]
MAVGHQQLYASSTVVLIIERWLPWERQKHIQAIGVGSTGHNSGKFVPRVRLVQCIPKCLRKYSPGKARLARHRSHHTFVVINGSALEEWRCRLTRPNETALILDKRIPHIASRIGLATGSPLLADAILLPVTFHEGYEINPIWDFR